MLVQSMTAPREVTAETLTDTEVFVLQRTTRSRTIEYLCRAWLQFGRGAMSALDVKRLLVSINARAKAGTKKGPMARS
jgi:hypothetical protein